MIYNKKNSGSTLIFSILVLATITSSMYVIGSTVIKNIQQLSSTVYGEASVLGADAGLEKGLWANIRLNNEAEEGNCDSDPQVFKETNFVNATPIINSKFCTSLLRPNPDNIILSASEDKKFYIIDPRDPENPNSGYDSIYITWVAGSGTVKICEWNNINCPNSPDSSFSQSGDNTTTFATSDQRYLVLVEASSSGYNFLIGGDPKGVPADQTTVNGFGENNFNQRKMDVKIAQ